MGENSTISWTHATDEGGMDDSLVKEMASVLRGYELWEADLVLCHEAWDTITGLPKLTQELYDKLLELQSRRNAVLERLGARN